jgi:hypothetical protein
MLIIWTAVLVWSLIKIGHNGEHFQLMTYNLCDHWFNTVYGVQHKNNIQNKYNIKGH